VYCLVCHNLIRISRLQELFATRELLLCGRCQSQFKRKSPQVLYEKNSWLEHVVDRLNQGDMCLIQIFVHDLYGAVLKHLNVTKEIIAIEKDASIPYPWLEILVAEVKLKIPKKNLRGEEKLFISQDFSIEGKRHIKLF